MLNDIKAVIFDLDGTLIDSMWMWKDIDIEYLGKHGLELPETLQLEIEGMSFSETAHYFKSKFNLKDSIKTIKTEWNLMARDKYANEVKVKEGAIQFLEYLKENHIKTGIATSNSDELVRTIMKAQNMEQYFDAIHTSCEVKKGKPAPDIYHFVASKLGVAEKDCLVFEDVLQGILAGKNAGMKVCAVFDEFSKEYDQEKKELADYYIESYHDICY